MFEFSNKALRKKNKKAELFKSLISRKRFLTKLMSRICRETILRKFECEFVVKVSTREGLVRSCRIFM